MTMTENGNNPLNKKNSRYFCRKQNQFEPKSDHNHEYCNRFLWNKKKPIGPTNKVILQLEGELTPQELLLEYHP